MAKKKKKKPPEIRNLLIVLVGGLFAAIVAVGALAYTFSGAGSYQAEKILLAPDILIGRVSLRDLDSETRLQRAWVFDRVDYCKVDQRTGARRHLAVSPARYQAFYERIGKEKSLHRVPEEARFGRGDSILLTLVPTGRFAAAFKPQQFQRVECSGDGNFLRIQLHDQNEQGEKWAVFAIDGIGKEMEQLLLGTR